MHDTLSQIPSPCYVLEEELLRRNLALIRSVKEAAGVNIILAFKAYALWKSFPVIREYIPHSTASSIHEARLAFEEMGSPAHTYSPAYTERDFPTILKYSSHITFNSLTQFERFYPPSSSRRQSGIVRVAYQPRIFRGRNRPLQSLRTGFPIRNNRRQAA